MDPLASVADFKRTASHDTVTQVGALLKSYQAEIDQLTNRYVPANPTIYGAIVSTHCKTLLQESHDPAITSYSAWMPWNYFKQNHNTDFHAQSQPWNPQILSGRYACKACYFIRHGGLCQLMGCLAYPSIYARDSVGIPAISWVLSRIIKFSSSR